MYLELIYNILVFTMVIYFLKVTHLKRIVIFKKMEHGLRVYNYFTLSVNNNHVIFQII
jgi:hypothetical protein